MSYPPGSFYFTLSFAGIYGTKDAAFQEVTGMNIAMETEEVVCGGENRFKYKLPGMAKFENLTLKRGFVAKGSSLAKWCSDTVSGGLNATITTHTITVKLLDMQSNIVASWDFLNAYPVKWGVSDFKSMENAYVVETLEFAYTYFNRKA